MGFFPEFAEADRLLEPLVLERLGDGFESRPRVRCTAAVHATKYFVTISHFWALTSEDAASDWKADVSVKLHLDDLRILAADRSKLSGDRRSEFRSQNELILIALRVSHPIYVGGTSIMWRLIRGDGIYQFMPNEFREGNEFFT